MELQPASFAQLQAANSGTMVLIEEDVGDVVKQIREVDDTFRVRYSEAGECFVVYSTDEKGQEYLVLTAQELDGRVLSRVREIASESYDFGIEVRAQDAAYEAKMDHRFSERVGEAAERLAHALREDRGLNIKPLTVTKEL